MNGRDHRDDAQPMSCIVFGLPIAIALWIIAIGVGAAITWAVGAWAC